MDVGPAASHRPPPGVQGVLAPPIEGGGVADHAGAGGDHPEDPLGRVVRARRPDLVGFQHHRDPHAVLAFRIAVGPLQELRDACAAGIEGLGVDVAVAPGGAEVRPGRPPPPEVEAAAGRRGGVHEHQVRGEPSAGGLGLDHGAVAGSRGRNLGGIDHPRPAARRADVGGGVLHRHEMAFEPKAPSPGPCTGLDHAELQLVRLVVQGEVEAGVSPFGVFADGDGGVVGLVRAGDADVAPAVMVHRVEAPGRLTAARLQDLGEGIGRGTLQSAVGIVPGAVLEPAPPGDAEIARRRHPARGEGRDLADGGGAEQDGAAAAGRRGGLRRHDRDVADPAHVVEILVVVQPLAVMTGVVPQDGVARAVVVVGPGVEARDVAGRRRGGPGRRAIGDVGRELDLVAWARDEDGLAVELRDGVAAVVEERRRRGVGVVGHAESHRAAAAIGQGVLGQEGVALVDDQTPDAGAGRIGGADVAGAGAVRKPAVVEDEARTVEEHGPSLEEQGPGPFPPVAGAEALDRP